MRSITVKPQSSLGINSPDYNVYSNGRQIGYCTPSDVEQIKRGILYKCIPVNNWRSTFSVELKRDCGLSAN